MCRSVSFGRLWLLIGILHRYQNVVHASLMFSSFRSLLVGNCCAGLDEGHEGTMLACHQFESSSEF